MSRPSPARPTRRVVQHKRIIDSSDEEDHHVEGQYEEACDTASCQTASLLNNSKGQGDIISPAQVELRSSIKSPDSDIHGSQVSDTPSSASFGSGRSLKALSPSSRCNVRASWRSEPTMPAELPGALPRSQSSETPEAQEVLASPVNRKSPLSNITNTTVNQMSPISISMPTETVHPLLPAERTIYEKPMDIVIRTRAKAATTAPEYTEPKSRLVITYLVLTNFKSYAGRQEVGPFHASFSSVVGPNGSGKSNVIDSLLFVFGFRASKMRQGKISALIHNSAAFPNSAFCEVEVHFQEVIDRPGGQQEVIPDSTLIVSRKAFQNNSSKYYINGSESTFTLVTNLLRNRGIDLDHKRFLILQGEVESIAQMKPKASTEHDDGLLEYLEDIIGTSKYKTPIEESTVETERLNEVCIEKASRVSRVESEKKNLEGKKDAALSYVKDENELAIKQSALYQIFVVECDDNIQLARESVVHMQTRIHEESEKYRGSEQEIEALKRESTAEAKLFERMEQSMQTTLKQLAKADKETVKFEEKEKHLQTKIKKLEKTISSSRFSASEATSHVERLTDELKRNSCALIDIDQRLGAEETQLGSIRDSLKGKTQGLSDEIGKKQKLLEPWTELISEKRSAIALAQSQLAILNERENAGVMALADAKERLARSEDEKRSRVSDLAEYRVQALSLEEESRQLQVSLANHNAAEPDQRSRLSAARQKADEAQASLSKSQTKGNVLAGLKRLKDSGRIKGFHGRLGDLAAIDGKYDIAISTACPALDNLVVDSVEVGQQCIEYLRKNNLGRANFILLNRLDHRGLDPIETPESVPRLFDLVRSKDDIFQPAFYSVLQNTLVAKDLNQANRIAYGAKRWRVVTVDGQLIDKSGTMSGGGTRIAKGSMSSKLGEETSEEQVVALEAEREKMERAMTKMQHERLIVETSLKSVKDRLPTCVTRIQKCSLEIESLDRDILDAKGRLSELSTKTEITGEDESQTKSLQATILGAERAIEELGSSASGIQAEMQALQDKIMEIGGIKLRGQKAKVDGLSEQLKALAEEISSAELSRAKSEKQRVKHEKCIQEAEQEYGALVMGVQQVKDEAEHQKRDATRSKREAEETRQVLDAKREALEALEASFNERFVEINEAKGIELEMRNQLDEYQKTLNENEKRLKYWQEKLKKLKTQDFSDLGEEIQDCEFVTYTKDELVDFDKDVMKGEIAILEERTANVNIELDVLNEYRRRVEEHVSRSSDLQEAIDARDNVKRRCEEFRRLRLEGFMEGFSAISLRLKEMYQMITMGGNAELELVDSLDPFSEGILFSVMPPKKSWKNISNLSGGEKTLSSLALVFALHHYKPTPLYVMDEIDAALDFRNVSIVASYIKERTKNAQFIVISLRNNMFELASRLVGVYKVNQMTKSVTVENRDYIARAP